MCIVLDGDSRVVFIPCLPAHVPQVSISVVCFASSSTMFFVVCLLLFLFFFVVEASLLCFGLHCILCSTFYCYALYSLHSSTGSDLELTTMAMDLHATG